LIEIFPICTVKFFCAHGEAGNNLYQIAEWRLKIIFISASPLGAEKFCSANRRAVQTSRSVQYSTMAFYNTFEIREYQYFIALRLAWKNFAAPIGGV